MKHHLPSLEAVKVFESAARHLSFSLAADELCISKGAVSYQIRKLEQSLDCALFRRSIRQVFLTNAGQQLFKTTRRLFSEFGATIKQIKPGESEHDVTIAATTYVALRWLSPLIGKFSEQHPEVSILLQHSVNSEEFRIQDVDFAIRWGALESFKSRDLIQLLPMPLYPVCSPKLLQRAGLKSTDRAFASSLIAQAELMSTVLLCEDRAFDLWQAWYGAESLPLQNARRIIADANVRTQAAIDGQGWTMADHLMQRDLESGALVAPFGDQLVGYGYAVQSAPGGYKSQSVRKLREWLSANL